jgi:hypothetical protein
MHCCKIARNQFISASGMSQPAPSSCKWRHGV